MLEAIAGAIITAAASALSFWTINRKSLPVRMLEEISLMNATLAGLPESLDRERVVGYRDRLLARLGEYVREEAEWRRGLAVSLPLTLLTLGAAAATAVGIAAQNFAAFMGVLTIVSIVVILVATAAAVWSEVLEFRQSHRDQQERQQRLLERP